MLLKIVALLYVVYITQCTLGFRRHRYKNENIVEHENKDKHECENITKEKDRNDNDRNEQTKNGIYTPCELDNIECIRKEMAENSDCDPRVFGSVPDPVAVPYFVFESAYFNASFYDQFLTIKNLEKCVVSAFYTNLTSDATMFAIDCPNITFEANRTVLHHRELEQDVLYRYNVVMVYRMLRIQIHQRPSYFLDFCGTRGTRAYGFIGELDNLKLLPFDKQTEEFIKCDALGIFHRHRTIFDREVALYAVNMYMRLYVNNRICNFKCKSLF